MGSYTVGTVKTHRKAQPPTLTCSFCGKDEYDYLVTAHKHPAHICDTCVEAAVSTLQEARRIERSQRYR